jgi:hypothetical protein
VTSTVRTKKKRAPREPDTHVRMQLNAVLVLKKPGDGLPSGLLDIDINEFVIAGLIDHYKFKLWREKALAAGAKRVGDVPEPTDAEIDAACPFGAVEGGAGFNWSATKAKVPK